MVLMSIWVLSCQLWSRAQVTGGAPAAKRLRKQRFGFYLEERDSEWGSPKHREVLIVLGNPKRVPRVLCPGLNLNLGGWETYVPLALMTEEGILPAQP